MMQTLRWSSVVITRLHRTFLVASLVASATGAPILLAAQHRDTALEGVWRFVAEVDRHTDGSVLTTGPAAGYDGLLIFTSNGYMSSTLTPKGRTWRRETMTPANIRDTFEATSAHAGRYEPDRAKHVIRMENLVTIDPGDEGTWDVIHYRVQRDTLELSGPWTFNGEKVTFLLRLRRVK